MLLREVIGVYFDNTEILTVGKTVGLEPLKFKAGGTYRYHYALNG
jgi:hypothetical protein